MKTSRKILSWVAVLLYTLGLLLGLALSGWYTWGEVEASLFVFRTGEGLLHLNCPLMLSPLETGTVSASFNNPTAVVVQPTVTAEIRHSEIPRTENVVLTLTPGEAKNLSWTVGRADRTFGALIQVNVFESSQPDMVSSQGSCGIMVSSLAALPGRLQFALLFAISLVLIGFGLELWIRANSPLSGLLQPATSAAITLSVILLASMLFILPRWWVLSGFFFLVALMLIVIIVTQFVLFPGDILARGPVRR